MSKLATVLVDLLCYLSIEPEDGLDIDEAADLQIDSWQTLIHELTATEKEVVKVAVKNKLTTMLSIERPSPDQEQLMAILDAFINDELH
jgi:hypothetical protein